MHLAGIEIIATTISGSPITTAVTQYAQLVEATTTSDDKTSMATNMVVSPKLLDVLQQAAGKACGNKRKRSSTCDLSQISEDTLRSTLAAVAEEQGIQLGTFLIGALTTVFLMKNHQALNQKQYVQPVTVQISDVPSAAASSSFSSSSDGPLVTAWIDPPYPGIDSWSFIYMELSGPTLTPPDDTTSTSLFCS